MSKKRRRQRNHNRQTGPASSPESNEDRAIALYQSAKQHLEAQRYRRAARDAAKSLKLLPDMPAPLLVYAKGAALSGDAQGSLEAFTKLVEMYEDEDSQLIYNLYSGRAVAYSKLERYEEAENDTNAMIALDPASDLAWMQRGSVRLDQGNYQGALDDLRHAADISPPDATLHCLMGETLVNLALYRLDHAHPDCTPAQNLDDARSIFHQGIHHLHTACDMDPRHPGAPHSLDHALGHAADFKLNPDGSNQDEHPHH